tara:strand:- start:2035 stop:2223 length:189 start_codon:yes stop_codon:yes gene_type:complete
MKESYTIAFVVTFESKVEVEVQADDETEAIELAGGFVDVAEAHSTAHHIQTDYWSTVYAPWD